MGKPKRKRRKDRGRGGAGTGGGPRPLWAGTISFGLVNVPVLLVPAVRSERIPLRQLGPDGTPLARRYVCPRDHQALSADELIRGYPLPSGELVPIPDEELESLEPDRSRNIELERFVPRSELSPRYFERGYFLLPDEGGERAYHLLVKAMAKRDRAGVGTFVMHGKQSVIAILADGGLLRGETLRFAEEVRSAEELGLEIDAAPDPDLTARLTDALAALEQAELPEDELEDPRRQQLRALIRDKLERGEGVVSAGGPVEEAEEEGEVFDLMQHLKASLAAKRAG